MPDNVVYVGQAQDINITHNKDGKAEYLVWQLEGRALINVDLTQLQSIQVLLTAGACFTRADFA